MCRPGETIGLVSFRDFLTGCYGPTIAVYKKRRRRTRAGRRTGRRELADLARRHDQGGGVMDWEYLLVMVCKQG